MIDKGKIYQEYKNHLIKKGSNRFSIKYFPSDKLIKEKGLSNKKYKVAIVNGGQPSVSLIGKTIVDEHRHIDFCLLYHQDWNNKRNMVSLRRASPIMDG